MVLNTLQLSPLSNLGTSVPFPFLHLLVCEVLEVADLLSLKPIHLLIYLSIYLLVYLFINYLFTYLFPLFKVDTVSSF